MRQPLIAGNWKMYKDIKEAEDLSCGIRDGLNGVEKVEVVLCPPFTNLYVVYNVIKDTKIELGAQNIFWEEEGAFTGEVSAKMVKSCGCKYVIIGHSERRKYFSETDETVNKKIKSALKEGLLCIVCIGETLEEREAGRTISVVETQLSGAFKDISQDEMKMIVIAYEPVWAIGTGKTATPQQAQEVHSFIRKWVSEKFSSECAQRIRILYGGSVKPDNIEGLIREDDIDGALVGGASLKIDSFVGIVKGAINV